VKRFINGYIVTTDNEEAPSRMLEEYIYKFITCQAIHQDQKETNLFQFNCSRMPKPTDSCAPKNATACFWLISPRAKGRSLVRAYY
jgi:hypothetical protein